MNDGETLRAALRLHLAAGVGALTYRRLIEAFGSPRAVLAASPKQWRGVQGVGEKVCRAIGEVTDEHVAAELDLAGARGAAVLSADDARFPAALRNIHDCPPVLYVRGSLEAADALSIGIVGARRCTYYGLEQAERFSQLLVRAGFTVVSGGARGIDAAAHRGALAAGGRTIAVMGCGLGRTYPPENDALFQQILADGRGAIVSEMPMAADIRAGNFHARNRIISALSLGVLVVEAARGSGSLITAREAIEQGREVFAVPGRVDSPMSQGTNELIRDGSATLVQGLEDILEHLGEVGKLMSGGDDEGEQGLPPGLDETEGKLAEALRGGPLSMDELVRRTGLPTGPAAAAMTMLVIKGAVAQQAGQVFALKRRGGGADGRNQAARA